MIRSLQHALSRTLAVASIGAMSCTAMAADREVAVTLTALDSHSAPIDGLRVYCQVEGEKEAIGITDDSGSVVLQVTGVSDETDRLKCGVLFYRNGVDGFYALSRTSRFENPYFVPIAPGQNAVQATLQFEPAVVVSARVIDTNGDPVNPIGFLVEGVGVPARIDVADSARCHIYGVSTNQSHVAWVGSANWLQRIEFAVADQDVDLGEIQVPDTDSIVNISLTSTNPSRGLSVGATLFTADGTHVVTMMTDYLGAPRFPGPDGTKTKNVRVQAGKYYVVPGSFAPRDWMVGIASRLRAGDSASLDAAGIPAVIATPTAIRSVTIDIEQIYGAAQAFAPVPN